MAHAGFATRARARPSIVTEVDGMTEVTHQPARTIESHVAADATESLQSPLLALLLVCWIAAMLVFLHLTSSRTPRGPTRRPVWTPPSRDSSDPWFDGGRWYAPEQGPLVSATRLSPGWRTVDRLHEVPVLVMQPNSFGRPSHLRDDIAAAMLEDLAGHLLDAGKRRFHRAWGGILLHGPDAGEVAAVATALARDHGTPLLVVRAHDVVPVDLRPIVKPIFDLATTMAPCVLLVEGVDELADPDAPLVVSRHARRIEHELATAVRTADPGSGVVSIATARSVEAVASALLQQGCLDRVISVGAPTARERRRLLHYELVRSHAVVDGALDELVHLTEGMSEHRIVEVLHEACRAARQRAPTDEPLSITMVDLRTALHGASGIGPLAIGRDREARVRALTHMARDPDASFGLVLAGEADNGCTEIARTIAARTRRPVAWIDGGDLSAVSSDEIEQMVRAACHDHPVVVVWDRLDALLQCDGPDDNRRKKVLAALEHLARTPGASVVVTMRDAVLLDPGPMEDGTLEIMWIPAPGFPDLVALLTHALEHVVLVDTTVEELASAMHSATRAQVVERCRAAIHAAALRAAPGRTTRLDVLYTDFPPPRG